MPTLYNVNKTFQGVNGYGTGFCLTTYSATLAANTATALTVPGQAVMGMASADESFNTFLAVFHFTPDAACYVANNATAAAPAGASFASTASVLNPTAKTVRAGDVLSFICVAGCDVCVEFFSTQEN